MNRLEFDRNDVKDVLLADVAIRIQLSPTNYRLAAERMETLAAWLDREGSELAGRVRLVYAQGSMAVHATIASCLTNDEFDIDVIAQVELAPGTTPQQCLDMLYCAVRGEKGSRYYSVTVRNTRCVTVEYANMHVDITPAELINGREPRVSHIFHHRPEEPHTPGTRVMANPFGFAEWFNAVTPRSVQFEEFFEARSLAMDRLFKAAETEDIPEQMPAYLKPPAVIALQLIKRFRNVRYDKRKGRRPPSVMLACLIAQFGGASGKPFTELLHQAGSLMRFFAEHKVSGKRVHVVNPKCSEDIFSDRWPADLDEQNQFLEDLQFLVVQLERLERDAGLETIADVFSQLFGEDISRTVVREFADRSGSSIAAGRLQSERGSGRIDLGRSGIITSTAVPVIESVRAAPRHTFYGPVES